MKNLVLSQIDLDIQEADLKEVKEGNLLRCTIQGQVKTEELVRWWMSDNYVSRW